MAELHIVFEDLSKQEVNYLLQCLTNESPVTGLESVTVLSQQIDYVNLRIQLLELAKCSPEHRVKMAQWLKAFQEKSADQVVVADLGPNETLVIVSGMVLLVAALHALSMKRITQDGKKTVEEYYSLPAELGKMFKSIPVGLIEAVQKFMNGTGNGN